MSIKTQKILLFIPGVNFIITFMFIKSCAENKIKVWFFLKTILKVIFVELIIAFIFAFFDRNVDAGPYYGLTRFILFYLVSFFFAFFCLKGQEKIIESNSNE